MATSKDIAERSGVSRATVSAVINGNKFVSAELRRRVEQAVAELDYRPHNIARSLKMQRTQTIGLVIPDIREPFFPAVARGVEDQARAAGYTVFLCNTDSDPLQEREFLDHLRERRVDGVILVSCGDASRPHVAHFTQCEVPLVMMDRTIDGIPADTVTADNVGAARMAVAHLLETGYRRIALLKISGLDKSYSGEMVTGHRQALVSRGIPCDEQLTGSCRDTIEESSATVIGLFRQEPRPDAIFVSGSTMIIGALQALAALGLRVPEDVALIGSDDPPWVAHLSPPVTVVTQNTYELGASATRVLMDRINKTGPTGPTRIVLPTELVIRRSCGCR